jgi:N-acetylglutamate synthase-like GNAT family acetyltransferase
MIHVCAAGIKDIHAVMQVAVKSLEFPPDLDHLKESIDDRERDIFLARISSRIVGMAATAINRTDEAVVINHIATHPDFRRNGVAKKLLAHTETVAWATNCEKLRMFVPHYLIEDDKDPWNLFHWLWKNGFNYSDIIHGSIFRYGKLCDLYVYDRGVSEPS